MKAISVENLSKSYRLGTIGTGTFFRDFERWFARIRGKPDPYARIGEADHGNRDSEEVWALRDVSFEVEQGEVLGIIGKNGAGKSTLLKILSRVTAPTTGQIKVRGRIASLLEVGTGFHPELTGRENIYLNGAILGMTREEVRRKFDEIVDFAGVEKYIDTPVKRYSSGMYVRLAFAVAAHLEPEILVVDEVLAVGDAEFQKKCLGKMGEVAKGGRTVLFVSHNMAAVSNLCAQSMLLRGGRLYTIGHTETIIKDYLSSHQGFSNTHLSSRQDVIGSRLILINYLKILNKENEEITQVLSGQEVYFVLQYQSSSGQEIKNVAAAITLSNMWDYPVMTTWTEFTRETFSVLPSSGEIICKIKKLPLIPGVYNFSISIRVKDEVAFMLKNAQVLEVVEGDFFGTGIAPKKNIGICLVQHSWSCSK